MGQGARPYRIFIAVYPPPAIVEALAEAVGALELPPHRPTPPDQVHLTLQFVGEIDFHGLEDVIESAERAAAGTFAFELSPDRLIAIPDRGPARLVAASAPQVKSLSELVGRLVTRLARKPRKERPFLPHLTLLRFRSVAPGLELERPIAPVPFTVDRISVMQSILKAGGAEHRALREIALG